MIRAHQSSARAAVFGRDAGVCSSCLLDTEAIADLVDEVTRERVKHWNQDRGAMWNGSVGINPQWPARLVAQTKAARLEVVEPFGWMAWWKRRSFWDADHVVPAHQGGASELGNLQTLCVGCHLEKTNRQRGS